MEYNRIFYLVNYIVHFQYSLLMRLIDTYNICNKMVCFSCCKYYLGIDDNYLISRHRISYLISVLISFFLNVIHISITQQMNFIFILFSFVFFFSLNEMIFNFIFSHHIHRDFLFLD